MQEIMDYGRFEALCGQGRPIPLTDETLADVETPVSALVRVAAAHPDCFLLESCGQGGRFSRYSFLGCAPRGVFTVEDGKPFLDGRPLPSDGNPMEALRPLLGRAPIETEGLPTLLGGAVGYVGYEMAGRFESLPPPKGRADTPEALYHRIEALTPSLLLEVANEMFAEDYLSTLIYQ